MSSSDRLPPRARAIRDTVSEAVAAAAEADPEAYARGTARLAALDPEQVRVVLGAAVAALLEELYPDGLDGDGLAETLSGCCRAAVLWWPGTDPNALVVLLSGALGSHDLDEEQAGITPAEMARTAPLLVADLLRRRGRSLSAYLDAALAEIARAETVEMP